MTDISEIDSALSTQMDLLEKIIDRLKFKKICEFEIQKKDINVPLDKMDYSGVYLFEIKVNKKDKTYDSWIKSFVSEWTDDKYLKKFTSNPKKTRYEKHNKLSTWMPVYLGKSKKIKSRIKQHLYQELSKKTFAMKLASREHLIGSTFRVSTIKIDVVNYNSVVTKAESQLRNKINPIVGKQ